MKKSWQQKNVEPKNVGAFSKMFDQHFHENADENFWKNCWIQHFCLHKCWCNFSKKKMLGQLFMKMFVQHFVFKIL
jgi:hypothetical protein